MMSSRATIQKDFVVLRSIALLSLSTPLLSLSFACRSSHRSLSLACCVYLEPLNHVGHHH